MKPILAALVIVVISALALPADAQPRHGKGKGDWQHRGHSYHRPDRGPGFGSIFGGIIGGLIGSQLNRAADDGDEDEDDEPVRLVPFSPEWYAYCSRKYRSFEPGTGLFTTYEGTKRFCYDSR